jgi:hypothetical protein
LAGSVPGAASDVSDAMVVDVDVGVGKLIRALSASVPVFTAQRSTPQLPVAEADVQCRRMLR